MKIYITILSLLACSISYADTANQDIEEFKLKVNKALTSRSLESISHLYEWNNTPYTIRDHELFFWRDFRLKSWKDHTKVTSIKWEPVEGWTKEQLDTYSGLIKGEEINGNTYVPNVPISGLFKINWTNKKDSNEGHMIIPVGHDKSGKYMFISTIVYRKDGQQPK